MKLTGRPLLDNAADQSLFIGRAGELRRIERSLRSGLNCLLIGDPGSGKTSLVRALMYHAIEVENQLNFTYVRANEAQSAGELLTAVAAAIRAGRTGPPRDGRPVAPIDLIGLINRDVAQARTAEPGPRTIVVEDVSPVAGTEVFGALRDEVWQIDSQWLVTTSTAHAASLLRPPADVFFETLVELGPLTKQEATELLRRRLDEPDLPESADLIEAATDSALQTPRRLLEVARELAAEPAVGGARFNTVRGLRARSAALEEVSRPARMLAGELEALGWVSASDERLLDRMGWTRPRVVQVIAELESRGLVDMREENTGRGRPRKLYRLTPGARFPGPTPMAGPPT